MVYRSDTGSKTQEMALKTAIRYPILDLLIIIASLVSLVIGLILFTSSKSDPVKIIFCILSIFTSWNLIHILYAVHYSEIFYQNLDSKGDGGIDFNGSQLPAFWDFAYLAYTIGMTYQVSDTNFSTTVFRKVALSHALLSFIFSTVLISTMINFIASLMS